jgi:hypothetical protein
VATSASSRKAKPVTEAQKNQTNDDPAQIESPQPTPADAPAEKTPAPTAPAKHAASEVDKETEASDIKALLSRHTFDGKGENAVPESDFRGFSTEGVEKGALKSTDDVVNEVLAGNWGSNAQVAVERLHAAGYGDRLDEIERVYNERKKRGAPSAF